MKMIHGNLSAQVRVPRSRDRFEKSPILTLKKIVIVVGADCPEGLHACNSCKNSSRGHSLAVGVAIQGSRNRFLVFQAEIPSEPPGLFRQTMISKSI